MEEQKINRRVRINLSQTAKRLVQFDITAEFETPEECGTALSVPLLIMPVA
ncbi:MAG: hypothetical protein LBO67_04670 [Spirochaetaceae bacterium]|jgi:hypothetical protein|nr:hypothetical protein [Spirochaetaceae bacterium]